MASAEEAKAAGAAPLRRGGGQLLMTAHGQQPAQPPPQTTRRASALPEAPLLCRAARAAKILTKADPEKAAHVAGLVHTAAAGSAAAASRSAGHGGASGATSPRKVSATLRAGAAVAGGSQAPAAQNDTAAVAEAAAPSVRLPPLLRPLLQPAAIVRRQAKSAAPPPPPPAAAMPPAPQPAAAAPPHNSSEEHLIPAAAVSPPQPSRNGLMNLADTAVRSASPGRRGGVPLLATMCGVSPPPSLGGSSFLMHLPLGNEDAACFASLPPLPPAAGAVSGAAGLHDDNISSPIHASLFRSSRMGGASSAFSLEEACAFGSPPPATTIMPTTARNGGGEFFSFTLPAAGGGGGREPRSLCLSAPLPFGVVGSASLWAGGTNNGVAPQQQQGSAAPLVRNVNKKDTHRFRCSVDLNTGASKPPAPHAESADGDGHAREDADDGRHMRIAPRPAGRATGPMIISPPGPNAAVLPPLGWTPLYDAHRTADVRGLPAPCGGPPAPHQY